MPSPPNPIARFWILSQKMLDTPEGDFIMRSETIEHDALRFSAGRSLSITRWFPAGRQGITERFLFPPTCSPYPLNPVHGRSLTPSAVTRGYRASDSAGRGARRLPMQRKKLPLYDDNCRPRVPDEGMGSVRDCGGSGRIVTDPKQGHDGQAKAKVDAYFLGRTEFYTGSVRARLCVRVTGDSSWRCWDMRVRSVIGGGWRRRSTDNAKRRYGRWGSCRTRAT